ncbi:MAG: DoxX family membrane protein [Candidatus Eisenbacteria bacterium]|nr:DoxX family membrane protein [Candidatus Eisenbacteria bacterium]
MTAVLIFLGLIALTILAGLLLLRWLPASGLSPRALAILGWVLRVVLALVFVRAAVPKLIDPFAFATDIYAYRVIPPMWAAIGAILMAAIEMVAAVALVTGLLWRGGAIVLGGMLLVFIAMIFQAIVRGIDIHCGCFGESSHTVSFWLIAQDCGLLLCALAPLIWDARRQRRVGLA